MLPQTQYPIFSMLDHGPAIIPTYSDPSLRGLGVNADFSWEYFSEGDVVEINNTVNLTIDVGLNETMVESGDKGFHLTTFVDVLPDKREGVVQESYRLSTYAFEVVASIADEAWGTIRFRVPVEPERLDKVGTTGRLCAPAECEALGKACKLVCAPIESAGFDKGKPHVRFCEGAHGNPGAITPVGGGL